MNFQDHGNSSVQSLLALLRSTQDGASSTSITPATASDDAGPSSLHPTSATPDARTLSRKSSGTLAPAGGGGSNVPSTQQLNDLLRSLGGPPVPAGENSSTGPDTSTLKVSRNIIEPFGPIRDFTKPLTARKSSDRARAEQSGASDSVSSRNTDHPREGAQEEESRGTWSFAKALPKLGEMMGDERFMLEVHKMKGDQDGLERRLWAKQEKIKADHEQSTKGERDIARISQRIIPAAKRAQWAAELERMIRDFHLQTCLPTLDSLSKRHRARLEELGVPGLGGDKSDERTAARWRKIMDLLQAGLEE